MEDNEKPVAIDIDWGDKIFHFASAEEARRAGFRVPEETEPEKEKAK